MRAGPSHLFSLKIPLFPTLTWAQPLCIHPFIHFLFLLVKKLTGTAIHRGHPWLLQPQQHPTATTEDPVLHFPHIPVSLGGDLSPGQHSSQTLLTHSFHLKSSQTLLSSLRTAPSPCWLWTGARESWIPWGAQITQAKFLTQHGTVFS